MSDVTKDHCDLSYNSNYENRKERLIEDAKKHSRRPKLSKSKLEEIEKDAQKAAIGISFIEMTEEYPDVEASTLWRYLYEVYVFRKSGIGDSEVISKAIKAEQSWRSASGHAFEELIKTVGTRALSGSGIRFILQKDLREQILRERLANQKRDLEWLEKWIKSSTFDLYAVIERDKTQYCFGCIQCKTSIRDRVTRDREPSIQAMENFFWSIAITLDGSNLQTPKYSSMVNGGSDEYVSNGWHGMYAMSGIPNNGRIYHTDIDLKVLTRHAQAAADFWFSQRQWFNHEWTPDVR